MKTWSYKKKFLLCFALIVFVGVVIGSIVGRDRPFFPSRETRLSSSHYYPLKFYSKFDFQRSLTYAAKKKSVPKQPILAGVVPHHLFVADYVADFFSRLSSGVKPETIILIGPNHYNVGGHNILTSDWSWQTPYGLLETNRDLLGAITSEAPVFIEQEPFQNEHAIGGLVSFIKYYLPKSTILHLILKTDTSMEEVDALVSSLKTKIGPATVLVASVDFSHYLTSSEAEKFDEETLNAMRSFDAPKIFSLHNEHNLDSPAAIAVLFSVMTMRGVDQFSILYHTNSGVLSRSFTTPTTSYFVLEFYE